MTIFPDVLAAITALVVAVTALVVALRARAAVQSTASTRFGQSGTVTRWEAPTGEHSTDDTSGPPPPIPPPPPPPPVGEMGGPWPRG